MAKKGSRIRTATPKKTTRKKVTAKRARRSSTIAGRQRLKVTIAKLILPGDQIQTELLRSAKGLVRRKRIPRRKVNPHVPRDKLLVGDAYPKPQIGFDAASSHEPMAAAPAKAAAGITIHYKRQFDRAETEGFASDVCEPSVAMNDKVWLVTGNRFVLQSSDGGKTFKFNHPNHIFEPREPRRAIHGDQVTLYSPNFECFFWLLQYSSDINGENFQRVAFATSPDVAAQKWRYVDISSVALLGSRGSMLDFPDVALTDHRLYVTTNAYGGTANKDSDWRATALVRIDIDRLLNRQVVAEKQFVAEKIVQRTLLNYRLAQNCKDTIYWSTHVTNSKMRVYAWKESDAAPTHFDVNIPTWEPPPPDYVETMPKKGKWLGRVDDRIVAGACTGKELYFGWTAGAGGVNARPNPYVQVARIDVKTRKLMESINLWDPEDAVCCPALGVDRNGEVGVSYSIGGRRRPPSHAVGYLTGNQAHTIAFDGPRAPPAGRWGDFLTVRRCYPQEDRLIATGYTMSKATDDDHAVPDLVIFSR
jgi:hypothetical protein